jgi:hypothetical protein
MKNASSHGRARTHTTSTLLWQPFYTTNTEVLYVYLKHPQSLPSSHHSVWCHAISICSESSPPPRWRCPAPGFKEGVPLGGVRLTAAEETRRTLLLLLLVFEGSAHGVLRVNLEASWAAWHALFNCEQGEGQNKCVCLCVPVSVSVSVSVCVHKCTHVSKRLCMQVCKCASHVCDGINPSTDCEEVRKRVFKSVYVYVCVILCSKQSIL